MRTPELLRLIDKRLAELGISASEASTRAVGNHYLIRNMHRRTGMPSVENLQAICNALGLEFYVGPPREPAPEPPTPALDRFSPSVEMPVRGWARCSIEGYLEGEKKFHDLPMPVGLEDEDAFYAMALGPSMRSEGVENGDYCVVSPNTPLAAGLRVWLKNHRDQVTIKRLLAETDKHYELLGWQDPDEKGNQAPYHDQWLKSYVKAKGAVLEVYRGRPSVKNPPLLIADPRPPPGLPKGARALEVSGAVEQRFTDEALRSEISTMRDEMARRAEATETALKELVSRLPPCGPQSRRRHRPALTGGRQSSPLRPCHRERGR